MDTQTRTSLKGDKVLAPIAGSRHAFTPWSNETDSLIKNSPLEGMTFTFEPDMKPVPYDGKTSTVLCPGMSVNVAAVYHTWNGVLGLDMLYVYVADTGHYTHVTPKQLGLRLH